MVEKKSSETSEKKVSKKEKKLTQAELEKKVVGLAKKGLTSEKIGLELRKEAINVRALGTKIGIILKKNKLYEDADIKNLTTKIETLKKHMGENKHDYRTRRAFMIKSAKLNKLKKIKKS